MSKNSNQSEPDRTVVPGLVHYPADVTADFIAFLTTHFDANAGKLIPTSTVEERGELVSTLFDISRCHSEALHATLETKIDKLATDLCYNQLPDADDTVVEALYRRVIEGLNESLSELMLHSKMKADEAMAAMMGIPSGGIVMASGGAVRGADGKMVSF